MKKQYFIQNVGLEEVTALLIEMEERDALLCADLFIKMNKNCWNGSQPRVTMREIEFCSKEDYENSSKENSVDWLQLYWFNLDDETVLYYRTIKVLVELKY